MKKLLMFAAATAMFAAAAGAASVPAETLRYSIRYKWGFLDANAGVATITTTTDEAAGTFTASLTGQSVDLLGHYYAGTDTMTGTMLAATLQPVYNQRITSEAGEFTIETITYDHTGDTAQGEIVKTLPDGKVVRSRVSHYAGGQTLDLLAVFYYMRRLPYQDMEPGQSVTVNIFAGNTPETLVITYHGHTTSTSSTGTYDISLTFSSAASATVDRMTVSLSDAPGRVPVSIDASLKYGHIACSLIGDDTALPAAD